MLIKKDGTILDVTKGAYKAFFEDAGWKRTKDKEVKSESTANFMNPQPKNNRKNKKDKQNEVPFGNIINESKEPELEEEEEEYEIVLEDMTVKELVEFAAENDIDLEGNTRKDDIISVIREVLEEE